MSIRIGVNPIGWSNDDMPELGGEIPLEQCLAEAHTAGYHGIEMGTKFPRQSQELQKVLEAHQLVLASGWYSASLLEREVNPEIDVLKPHLELLRDCGCKVLIFAETSNTVHGNKSIPLSKRPTISSDQWDDFGQRITEVAEWSRANGLQLVYHHHMGTVIQTEDEIHSLMRSTSEAVHLLLDTGHATWGGSDPVKLANKYRDRISHIHVKDVRPHIMQQATKEDLSFLDAVIEGVFTVPGDGCIDFVKVLNEFPNYKGWIVVEAEQYDQRLSAGEFAKLGADNVKGYLEQARLKYS